MERTRKTSNGRRCTVYDLGLKVHHTICVPLRKGYNFWKISCFYKLFKLFPIFDFSLRLGRRCAEAIETEGRNSPSIAQGLPQLSKGTFERSENPKDAQAGALASDVFDGTARRGFSEMKITIGFCFLIAFMRRKCYHSSRFR